MLNTLELTSKRPSFRVCVYWRVLSIVHYKDALVPLIYPFNSRTYRIFTWTSIVPTKETSFFFFVSAIHRSCVAFANICGVYVLHRFKSSIILELNWIFHTQLHRIWQIKRRNMDELKTQQLMLKQNQNEFKFNQHHHHRIHFVNISLK